MGQVRITLEPAVDFTNPLRSAQNDEGGSKMGIRPWESLVVDVISTLGNSGTSGYAGTAGE